MGDHYGSAYVEDEETGAIIHIKIEVVVPIGYTIEPGQLDAVADDAVESVLVQCLYEIDSRDFD